MPIDDSAVEAVLIAINSCFSLFNLYWDCLIHQCKGQDGRTAEMWNCMGCSLYQPIILDGNIAVVSNLHDFRKLGPAVS